MSGSHLCISRNEDFQIEDDLFLLAGHSHRFIFFKFRDGSLSQFCFTSVTIAITSGPSGRVGRLVVRPCCRPWLGPFGSALAGLPVAADRLALRAADLACVCCRVKS